MDRLIPVPNLNTDDLAIFNFSVVKGLQFELNKVILKYNSADRGA
jgi:hypothetical protein